VNSPANNPQSTIRNPQSNTPQSPNPESKIQNPKSPVRYFIADCHLDSRADTPRAQNFHELLLRLSDECATRPVELYILGDLFEFWCEYHRQLFEIYEPHLKALEDAWHAGVKIFLINGNRDFAYGDYVLRRFGATVLGDGQAITLNDTRPVWLEHGDLLCTADRRYLLFRRLVRSWPVRLFYWMLPWALAKKLIARVRQRTAADKAAKPPETLAIDLTAARRRLEEHTCKLLLCGHFHRAYAEDLGAGLRVIILPAWCDDPSGMADAGNLQPFSLNG
jgi:UDP-2,3-diacylglucosamine hydrolase